MPETLPYPVILARRVLTSVSGKELQGIAVSLIESGHDSPDLHELAWDPVISDAEAGRLFDAVAAAMGLVMPSRAEAAKMLVYYHISRIEKGHCTPWEGLAGMMKDAYWPELSEHAATRYVGDADGLEHFVAAYWSYGDLRDSPDVVGYEGLYGNEAKEAFDEHVRNLAAEWLLEQPTSSVSESGCHWCT